MASRLRTRLRASTGLATPSLNIELATAAGGLDPRVTFSRGTQATLTDSTGKITYAPNNLLTNSESFEATAWNKVAATVTANATAAPDGTTTADALVEDGTTAAHYVQQFISYVAGVSYTFSVYLKAGIRSWVEVDFPSSAFGVAQGGYFNLSGNGSLGNATGSPTNRTITAVGNGWYRVSVTATATATAGGNTLIIAASANGTTSYAGSNGSTALSMWGAQLEAVTYQTTPGTYNSTTPKNLLGYTQEFDNATWGKVGGSVTANTVVAPDGTSTADTYAEDTASSLHYSQQAVSGISTGQTVTGSFYFKAGTRTYAVLSLYNTTSNNYAAASFDLLTGAVANTAVAGTGISITSTTVTSAGDGWYRCAITAVAGTNTFIRFGWGVSADGTVGGTIGFPTYLGTSGTLFIWGAQLSNSASLDPYVYNPGAAPTSAAYYGPRFDYDPVTLAPKGLLIEETRANLFLRSQEFSNISWARENVDVADNVVVSPDGSTNAAKITETVATGAHRLRQTVTVVSGTTYATSFYLKAAEREFAQVRIEGSGQLFGVNVNLTNGASSTTSFGSPTGTSASVTNAGNGWWRVAMTITSNTTSFNCYVYVTPDLGTTSYTGDGTSGIYVWGAQLEAGAFATSYIPTVASTVTRSADVATMTGDNFSSWYNQSEGTFVAFADTLKPSGFAQTANLNSANDGTSSNAVSLRFGTSNATGLVQTGGTAQTGFAGTAYTANTPVKWGMAYQLNNTALCVAGGSATTDTSVTVGLTMTQMNIGARNGALDPLNGHIQSIQYYPTRLTDTQLQVLST